MQLILGEFRLRSFVRPRHAVLAVAAMALQACDNPDALEANAVASVTNSGSSTLPALTLSAGEAAAIDAIQNASVKQKELASVTKLARAGLEKVLFDPGSAQFTELRAGRNGSACGKYNAKNRYGAYVGFKDFIVTKDREVITSDSNDGLEGLPGFYFASQYLAYCATQEERTAYLKRTAPMDTADDSWSGSEPVRQRDPIVQDEPDAILDAPADDLGSVPDSTT